MLSIIIFCWERTGVRCDCQVHSGFASLLARSLRLHSLPIPPQPKSTARQSCTLQHLQTYPGDNFCPFRLYFQRQPPGKFLPVNMKMTNETCWSWKEHTAEWEDVGLFNKIWILHSPLCLPMQLINGQTWANIAGHFYYWFGSLLSMYIHRNLPILNRSRLDFGLLLKIFIGGRWKIQSRKMAIFVSLVIKMNP